jgi:hypothetical protein
LLVQCNAVSMKYGVALLYNGSPCKCLNNGIGVNSFLPEAIRSDDLDKPGSIPGNLGLYTGH